MSDPPHPTLPRRPTLRRKTLLRRTREVEAPSVYGSKDETTTAGVLGYRYRAGDRNWHIDPETGKV